MKISQVCIYLQHSTAMSEHIQQAITPPTSYHIIMSQRSTQSTWQPAVLPPTQQPVALPPALPTKRNHVDSQQEKEEKCRKKERDDKDATVTRTLVNKCLAELQAARGVDVDLPTPQPVEWDAPAPQLQKH